MSLGRNIPTFAFSKKDAHSFISAADHFCNQIAAFTTYVEFKSNEIVSSC